jgi:hypothetical protein
MHAQRALNRTCTFIFDFDSGKHKLYTISPKHDALPSHNSIHPDPSSTVSKDEASLYPAKRSHDPHLLNMRTSKHALRPSLSPRLQSPLLIVPDGLSKRPCSTKDESSSCKTAFRLERTSVQWIDGGCHCRSWDVGSGLMWGRSWSCVAGRDLGGTRVGWIGSPLQSKASSGLGSSSFVFGPSARVGCGPHYCWPQIGRTGYVDVDEVQC